MRLDMRVWIGLVIIVLAMSRPVSAQQVTPADRDAIRAVVQQQLEAFGRDDAEAAFSFASPSIQEKFGTPHRFMQMVKTAYPPVYRPRRVVFQNLRVIGTSWVQPVILMGPDHVLVTALYPMRQLSDGVWKIDGCYLQPIATKSM